MIEEAIFYHSVIVKIFLVLLLFNLLVPVIFNRNITTEMRWTRVTFFIFSGFLSMTLFSGLMAYMFMNIHWNMIMTLMVLSFIVLTGLEIVRSRELHKLWMLSKSASSISWKYVLLEIMVVAVIVLLVILEKQGAISL